MRGGERTGKSREEEVFAKAAEFTDVDLEKWIKGVCVYNNGINL